MEDIADLGYLFRVKEIQKEFGRPTVGYLMYKLGVSKKYAQKLLDCIGNKVDISDIPKIPLSYWRKKGLEVGAELEDIEKEA